MVSDFGRTPCRKRYRIGLSEIAGFVLLPLPRPAPWRNCRCGGQSWGLQGRLHGLATSQRRQVRGQIRGNKPPGQCVRIWFSGYRLEYWHQPTPKTATVSPAQNQGHPCAVFPPASPLRVCLASRVQPLSSLRPYQKRVSWGL